jgi:hypothetical protein
MIFRKKNIWKPGAKTAHGGKCIAQNDFFLRLKKTAKNSVKGA